MGFFRARMYALFVQPCVRRRPPVRDNWQGEWHYAQVVKVYDGDTITAVVHRHGRWLQQSIRLAGIDTPELHPDKKMPGWEHEAAKAVEARTALCALVENKHVWLHCTGREKFGRILGTVYTPTFMCGKRTPSVNDQMVASGHAVAYTGGKKTAWTFHTDD